MLPSGETATASGVPCIRMLPAPCRLLRSITETVAPAAMNARPPSGVTETARVRPGRATPASAWSERVSSRNAVFVLVATTTTRARAATGTSRRSVRATRSGRTKRNNTVDYVQSRSLYTIISGPGRW